MTVNCDSDGYCLTSIGSGYKISIKDDDWVGFALKKHLKASAIPIYAIAALWLIYALFFPLYKAWHFLIPAVLSAAVYLLLKRYFPGKVYYTMEPEPAPNTGNAALDAAIRQGRQGIAQLRELNDRLEDPYISRQLEQLETSTRRIFDQVTAHPELLPQIRKFMNYYLPTTIRLLESYRELDTSGAAGKDVNEAKQRIVGMLDTVVAAFQHQLDALFSARTLDINAEVEVLETMMAAEGMKSDASDHGLHL